MKNKIIGVCPNCGANVVEREKGWFCENRECRFVLWKDNAFLKRLGKRMDAHVADKLLRDGRVRLKDCKSAKGKTYNAIVLLSCEADGRSKFSQNQPFSRSTTFAPQFGQIPIILFFISAFAPFAASFRWNLRVGADGADKRSGLPYQR